MRMLSATKRRTPLRAGVWPGDVWALGTHRLTVGHAPGDLDVAEAVLRAFGLYTGQHAQLVERLGVLADHGAAAQLTYEAGYESAVTLFEACAGARSRAREAWGRQARASVALFSLPAVHAAHMAAVKHQQRQQPARRQAQQRLLAAAAPTAGQEAGCHAIEATQHA